jgi:hypothetical protein
MVGGPPKVTFGRGHPVRVGWSGRSNPAGFYRVKEMSRVMLAYTKVIEMLLHNSKKIPQFKKS